MADTEKLRAAVKHFAFAARPRGTVDSEPCSVGDLKAVIEQIEKVLNTFIHELESE